MARLLGFLIALAACGSAKSEDDGPRCEDVAARTPVEAWNGDVVKLMLAHCKLDHWSREARTCMVQKDPYQCAESLTPVQRKALSADLLQGSKNITVTVKKPAVSVDTPAPPQQAVIVELPDDNTILVNGMKATLDNMDELFRAAAKADPNTQVVFRASKTVSHGVVVKLLERAKAAGLSRMAIGTQP